MVKCDTPAIFKISTRWYFPTRNAVSTQVYQAIYFFSLLQLHAFPLLTVFGNESLKKMSSVEKMILLPLKNNLYFNSFSPAFYLGIQSSPQSLSHFKPKLWVAFAVRNTLCKWNCPCKHSNQIVEPQRGSS